MRNANSTFARSLDSVGWALFFMWVGTALLAGFSWTVSLVGTAVIVLGVQIVLLARGERADVFMSAVGFVLLVGAIADLFGSPLSFVPAFLIVIGVAMLADAIRPPAREPAMDERRSHRPTSASS
jgi:hypothetical protein